MILVQKLGNRYHELKVDSIKDNMDLHWNIGVANGRPGLPVLTVSEVCSHPCPNTLERSQ